MPAIKYRFDDLMAEAVAPAPVAEPLGDVVSQVRSRSITSQTQPNNRVGVWECTPGVWRRKVMQAEYCHFLAGEAVFKPDQGEPIEIRAGDVVYFPHGSTGVWEIAETSRKIFIVFDEAKCS